NIEHAALNGIMRRLYYPYSPYEFSVLPADTRGQVYEQFLGKVIRVTEGHQAKIEDKPEVKKAGGVYYTPTYIVDYIVKNTVGKLLAPSPVGATPASRGGAAADASIEPGSTLRVAATQASPLQEQTAKSLTPKQAAKLKILDPAC